MEYTADLIEKSPVILLEFYADWCPHCRKMMPVVDDVRELLDGRAPVVQLNIDEATELASQLDVQGVPTFIVIRNGQEVWRTSGELSGDFLVGKVEGYLAD